MITSYIKKRAMQILPKATHSFRMGGVNPAHTQLLRNKLYEVLGGVMRPFGQILLLQNLG